MKVRLRIAVSYKILSPCILSLILSLLLLSAPLFPDHSGSGLIPSPTLSIKAWRIEEGLPSNAIRCILQSRDGYMWLGSDAGLIRFNGMEFRIWNRWNTPEWKSDSILSMAEDTDGNLWLGTDGDGVYRFSDGKWRIWREAEDLARSPVQAIVCGSGNDLWFAAGSLLFRIRNKKLEKIPLTPETGEIHSLLMDHEGTLWIGGENGLFRYTAQNTAEPGKAETIESDPVYSLTEDRNGTIWIAGLEGIHSIPQETIPLLAANEYNWENRITAIHVDQKRRVWAGTRGEGIFCLQKQGTRRINTKNGLSDDFITSIHGDAEGNIWIGTEAGGLLRLKPRDLSIIEPLKDEGASPIGPILVASDRTLWIGTWGSGLFSTEDGRIFRKWSRAEGLADDTVLTLHENNEILWIGTGRGLCRIRNQRAEKLVLPGFQNQPAITAVLARDDAPLLLGTRDGLLVLQENPLRITRSYLPGNRIQCLLSYPEGGFWIGCRNGLFRLDKGEIFPIHGSGTPPTSSLDVLSLYEAPAHPGILWIGTNGSGLFRFNGNDWSSFSIRDGLPSNTLSSIIPVKNGTGRDNYLWFGASSCLFRLSINELEKKLEGKREMISVMNLDRNDGLPPGGFTPGVFPSLQWTGSALAVSTAAGVALIGPDRSTSPPPVYLEEIRLNGESINRSKSHTIPSGKNLLEFYFSALDFSAPEKIRYRFRLEGFDQQWTTLSPPDKPAAVYFNLSPGRYRFRILAAGRNGDWNETGDTFTFRIGSRRKGFWLLIALLLILPLPILLLRRRKSPPPSPPSSSQKKYSTSALTLDRAEEISLQLKEIIEKEKVFLDPALTLKKLSEKIMVHPNYISQIINEQHQKNFNDFINSFRIAEAIQRMRDPRQGKKSLLDIAYDVGFYSKSVFNTAFKKFTGVTPSEYRKKIKRT